MKTKNLFPCLGVALLRSRVVPALIAVLNLIPAGRVTAQTFTTLHSFTGYPSDGAYPWAGLILSGNTLYGTAYQGGSFSYGTVFAVNTDGTGFTNLHQFRRQHYRVVNGCTSDLACPYACAQFGGGGHCHSFIPANYCECDGYSDGNYPFAGLIANSSGNTLYGTSHYGGSWDAGTVFVINTNGTGFTNLYSFTGGNTGTGPYAALILTNNTLYGTTRAGGSWGNGTVFKVNTDGTGFTKLLDYGGSAGLILSGNTLYGTADYGGSSGKGMVFAVNTDGTGFTNLHSFTATSTDSSGFYTNSDGANPQAGLNLSGTTLYGTAVYGGNSGNGTVFAVNTDGTGFTTLHSFSALLGPNPNSPNSDGAYPYAGLILSGNTLYGTASGGGSSSNGTLFAVNTDGTGFTNLHSFTASATNSSGVETNGDGANPYAGLILSGNTLYGTASSGGSSGNGTVFSLSFRPQLTITPSGIPPSGIILSWPANVAGFDYTGYTLQSATNLGSPVWSTNSPAPVVIGGQNTVTNPITGPQEFYRLSQ